MKPKVDEQLMAEIVQRIRRTIIAEKIVLFGSHARGDASDTSDLDILVIASSEQPRHRRAAPLYHILRDIPLPMDILVFSPAEVRKWENVPRAFVTTALREGRILYVA